MERKGKKIGWIALTVGAISLAGIGAATAFPGKEDSGAWAERKAEMLQKYDANKDGKLDDAERAVMKDDHAKAMFAKLDANKDGVLSFDEFKAVTAMRGHHRHHHKQ